MHLQGMHPLDNVIWNSLVTRHAQFAEGNERARRFIPEVSMLGTLAAFTPPNYDALAKLQRNGEATAMFLNAPAKPPSGWTVVREAALLQMVLGDAEVGYERRDDILRLGARDAPEMVELAALTKPGPFSLRTHELGTYLGIRAGGKLAAMAGERLKVAGFTEVSGVCTHPEHTGKGYARTLMGILIEQIRGRGERPFLHVRENNTRALEIYKRMGFEDRVLLHLLVVKKK
jgi:ribosomal protein S18 acetylase RimI-like enzyme